MKTVFALLLVALFAFSCSESTKVVTADLVAGSLSTVTITALDCEAKDVVKADITTAVHKWFKIQEETQQGILKDLCKASIAEVVPTLIGATIPPTWNCKQTKLDNAAEYLAEKACADITK